jgi:hypothetical protein
LNAFLDRINERMNEARAEAVKAAAVDVPGGESTALVRLNGALVKVQKYIDDKFAGRNKRGVSALYTGRSTNAEGAARGRAAADSLNIGRKAVTGRNNLRGLLGK